MEEHKNIDRLFQEKFKDFEIFPEPKVWKNIENQMMKKKKRTIIPLWFRLGVAAAILIGLFATGLGYFNQDEIPKSEIEISNKNSKPAEGDAAITKTDDIENEESKKDVITPKTIQPNANSGVAFIATPNKKTNNVKREENILVNSASVLIETPREGIASIENTNINSDTEIPALLKIEEKSNALNKASTAIQDAIALQDSEDPILKEALDLSKWSIGSIVAPVYFRNFGTGSPIDVSLAQNDKSSNAGLSYGIKVNYKLSDKLSIQSGLNTVELGYATKNAAALLSSSLTDNSNTNIDSNLDGVAVEVFSTQRQNSETFSQRSLFDNSGEIDQTLNYIEWPIEAKLSVVDKKVGLNLVGGMSTYVLYHNNVSLTSFGKTTSLGEASNVNTINFSGNLGLDLKYNISKKIFINTSPMFKYNFKTFSGDTGSFKPYFLGIYTGLNFRF